MGGLVGQSAGMANLVLHGGESEAAEAVVSNDHKVNAFDIGGCCINIPASRQPTASDLRLVPAVIQLTADLERTGKG